MTINIPATITRSASPDPAFEQRCLQATKGDLLPRLSDLIRGCPFCQGDIEVDTARYVEAMFNKLAPPEDPVELLAPLEAVLAAPSVNTFIDAATAFEAAARFAPRRIMQIDIDRFHFYAALYGSKASINKIAAQAFQVAYAADLAPAQVQDHVAAAVAWLFAATGKFVLPTDWSLISAKTFLLKVHDEFGPGPGLLERMMDIRREMVVSSPIEFTLNLPRHLAADTAAAQTINRPPTSRPSLSISVD